MILRVERFAAAITACLLLAKMSSSTPAKMSSSTPAPLAVYPVDEHIFPAVVDHYSFRSTNRTFSLRYYVNEQNWQTSSNNNGPCFFYAGNEANIFQFINNSGFLFEAAEEFSAMVVFAEHRYYGESIPDDDDMSFLTVEQAMADFTTLNVHIRRKWSMPEDVAFVVFGGSYGGNLAMWLRLKNPNLWAGAIASSATPLKHVLRETNHFALIETQAYGNVSEHCPALVRLGWKELYKGAASGDDGRAALAEALDLCAPLPDSDGAADKLHGWISNALETMVQYGYPYPTGFYNPLPAYPFKAACQGMLASGTGLGALRAAARVYYNFTGQAGSCFGFDKLVVKEAIQYWHRKGDRGRLLGQQLGVEQKRSAWGYQICTEVYQPMPTDGKTDFEVPHMPNQTAYYADCWRRYGVQPRPNWEEITFMGSQIQAGSNIFLANGQLDPWRAAGIQEKPVGAPDSIVVRTIENGAHHLDLRASNPMDPPSVIQVRQEQKAAMRQWIAEWKQIHPPQAHTTSSSSTF